jgi:hypothetical protein
MLKDSPSIGCQSQRAYLVADYAERACLANEDFDDHGAVRDGGFHRVTVDAQQVFPFFQFTV